MKPITLTPADIQTLVNDFTAAAEKLSFWDTDTLSYSKDIRTAAVGDQRISITFTAVAYAKMRELVRLSSVEVAWHGTVERLNTKEFLVTDIVVYPQTVYAANVTTDQEEYDNWMNELPCEVFNKIRLQGHSHVHMPPTPSSTDNFNQRRTLQLIDKDDYYISMILNKRDQWTCRVFDQATNILYDEKDIDITVQPADQQDLTAALKDIAEQYESMTKQEILAPFQNYPAQNNFVRYPGYYSTAESRLYDTNTQRYPCYSAVPNYESRDESSDPYYKDDAPPPYYGYDAPPYCNSSSYVYFGNHSPL